MKNPFHGQGLDKRQARRKARDASKADCGTDFEHEQHLYTTERGKVKACDGSLTKRK